MSFRSVLSRLSPDSPDLSVSAGNAFLRSLFAQLSRRAGSGRYCGLLMKLSASVMEYLRLRFRIDLTAADSGRGACLRRSLRTAGSLGFLLGQRRLDAGFGGGTFVCPVLYQLNSFYERREQQQIDG